MLLKDAVGTRTQATPMVVSFFLFPFVSFLYNTKRSFLHRQHHRLSHWKLDFRLELVQRSVAVFVRGGVDGGGVELCVAIQSLRDRRFGRWDGRRRRPPVRATLLLLLLLRQHIFAVLSLTFF